MSATRSRKTRLQQENLSETQQTKRQRNIEVPHHSPFHWDAPTTALQQHLFILPGKNPKKISSAFASEGISISAMQVRDKLSTQGIKKQLPEWYVVREVSA